LGFDASHSICNTQIYLTEAMVQVKLLVFLFFCIHSADDSIVNIPTPMITKQMFLYKSISTCVKPFLYNLHTRASEVAKSIYVMSPCFRRIWKRCFEMTPERTIAPRQYESWFPCNKGVMVTTRLRYILVVNTFNSFHFNVTFLKMQLSSNIEGCNIDSLEVI